MLAVDDLQRSQVAYFEAVMFGKSDSVFTIIFNQVGHVTIADSPCLCVRLPP